MKCTYSTFLEALRGLIDMTVDSRDGSYNDLLQVRWSSDSTWAC